MNRYKLYSKLLEKDIENRKLRKKKQRQQQVLVNTTSVNNIPKPKINSIITKLKTQFEYTCDKCQEPILYDTLFIDDFTGKYISLDRETIRTHWCNTKRKKQVITLVR